MPTATRDEPELKTVDDIRRYAKQLARNKTADTRPSLRPVVDVVAPSDPDDDNLYFRVTIPSGEFSPQDAVAERAIPADRLREPRYVSLNFLRVYSLAQGALAKQRARAKAEAEAQAEAEAETE